MKIRPFTENDFPALVELWKEFMDFHIDDNGFFQRSPDGHENWARFIRSRLHDEDFFLALAELDNSPVGYIAASVMEYPPVFTLRKYGFISDMAVTASARRQGIARALFQEARHWLESREVTRIELKVDAFNSTSQAFWKGVGFLPHTETWTRPVANVDAHPQPQGMS